MKLSLEDFQSLLVTLSVLFEPQERGMQHAIL